MGTSYEDAVGPAAVPPPQVPDSGPAKGTSYEDAVSGPIKEAPPTDAVSFSDRMRAMDVEHKNRLLAVQQGVTPNFDAHRSNVLGSVVYTDNPDEVGYYEKNDKGDHEYKKADANKHVILTDPIDGQMKIIARSPDTDTPKGLWGKVLGLSSVLAPGLAATAPGQAAMPTGEAVQAAVRQGINIPKGLAQEGGTGTALSKVPWVGKPLQNAAGAVAPQIEGRVAQTADNISSTGEAATAAEAGEGVRAGLTAATKDTAPIDAAYKKVDSMVDSTIKSDLQHTTDIANNIWNKYSKTGFDKESGAVSEILGPLTKPGGVNYDSLKFLRTRVGQMLRGSGDVDISKAELKQLYGTLSDDLRDLVGKAGGKQATTEWEKANSITEATHAKWDNLQTVLNVKNDEGVTAKLHDMAGTGRSANVKVLAQAKNSMTPDQWKDTASSIITKLGQKTTGGDTVFDATKFGNDYSKLSEEGKNLLFGTDSPHRQALDDIAKVSERWPELATASHGGGVVAHSVGWLLGAQEAWHTVSGFYHSGEIMRPLAVATAALGGRAVASFLSNPVTARNFARWSNTYEDVAKTPTAIKVTAFKNATDELAKQISSELEIGDPGTISDYLRGFHDYSTPRRSNYGE